MRLGKYLASCGLGSRRQCDTLIQLGRIFVNGENAQLGTKIDPEKDSVYLDNVTLLVPESKVYIVINKPVGYICANFLPYSVFDLVPDYGDRLHVVGRFGVKYSGNLVLTNDGDFTKRVLEITLEKRIEKLNSLKLKEGQYEVLNKEELLNILEI